MDYNVYQDDEGNYWYVPLQEITCETCNGSGIMRFGGDWHECPICEGIAFREIEHRDLMLSAEEYESEHRQQFWLSMRYGRRIPNKISDYWTGQRVK